MTPATVVATDPKEARLIEAINASGVDGGMATSDAIDAINAYVQERERRSVAFWKADSAAAWDKCEERRRQLANLLDAVVSATAQLRHVYNLVATEQLTKTDHLKAHLSEPIRRLEVAVTAQQMAEHNDEAAT